MRHRIGMFTDMGMPLDVAALDRAFRAWLAETMPAGTYRAWLVETADGATSSPAAESRSCRGLPVPRYMGDRLAFVYNVYTEPAHRRRGLARLIMDTIHALVPRRGHHLGCAERQPATARPLYEVDGVSGLAQPDDVSSRWSRYNPAAQALPKGRPAGSADQA